MLGSGMERWSPADARRLSRTDRVMSADVRASAVVLDTLAARLPGALLNITDNLAGQPRAGGGGVAGGGVSDPTGGAAVAPDLAAVDRRQVSLHAKALARHTAALAEITERWRNPSPPRDTPRGGTPPPLGTPLCRSCSRTRGPAGTPREVRACVTNTTCGGVLPAPMALCTWCYRFTLDEGTTPTADQVEHHHQGRRVQRKVKQ
jgi:hypothetical protein